MATHMVLGQGNIKGRIFENTTRIELADIEVRNLKTNEFTLTDDKGKFSIAAKPGDILTFHGFAYNPDTLLLTDMHDREVFLVPQLRTLVEVKVITDSTKNFNTYYDPEFHGQTVVYSRDANLNYTGGITIRFHVSQIDKHRREKRAKKLKEQTELDEVIRIFRPANIARFVPLKGMDMTDFLILYTPTIKVYFAPGFDLPIYLSDCYKKFVKLPEDKKHQQKLVVSN
ncbi:MAG: hypothetical protein ACYDDY_15390 [Mucilaginibacter sp.]